MIAGANNAGTANVALSTFTSSAIVVYLMQRLKQAQWFPLVQADRAKLNRLFSIGAAAIGAMSVEWVWDPGVRSLTIHIPTLWVAVVGLWHWLNHYAMQETIYQAAVNHGPLQGPETAPPPVNSGAALPAAGAENSPVSTSANAPLSSAPLAGAPTAKP